MSGWSNQAVSLIVLQELPGTFSGLFAYSPAPGKGNLLLSAAAQGGTDPFGNPYDAGIEIHAGPGQMIQLVDIAGVAVESFFTGSATEAAPGQIKAGTDNQGGPAETQVMVVGGPTNTVSDDAVFIELAGSPHNAAGTATGFLSYQLATGGDRELLSWGGPGLSRSSVAGLTGGVPLNEMDFFTRTANSAAVTALTTSYAIPASDASTPGGQQTTYRLRAWGTGTEANPAVSGTFSISMFGVNVYTSATQPWAQAGHGFDWYIDAWVMISGNSATATFIVGGLFVFTDTTAGTQVISPIVGGANVDNLVAGSMTLEWQWASITGSPTISCPGSVFTREGV